MKPWKLFCALNIAFAIAMAALGYLAGPSWLGMFYAALFGFNFAAAFSKLQSHRWQSLVERSLAAFQQMSDLNDALIRDRVVVHELVPDPADEHRPRLH